MSSDEKVIHIEFGSKRRIDPPAASGSAEARVEPTRDSYSRKEVAKLLATTEARLRSLERRNIVVPSAVEVTDVAIEGATPPRRRYTFQDLIAVRTALALLARGVPVREVAQACAALDKLLPKVKKPLLELRVVGDGRRVVVQSAEGGKFLPTTGQMLIDFEVASLRDDVVRILRPADAEHRARMAFDLYRRASELDEDRHSMDEAEQLYRRAVELDPLLAIAYTNLGNILFRKGEEAGAETLYVKALSIDPKQPEAKYNLGYLMLERRELAAAVGHFRGAIEADPRFADAYFNLAMAYEEQGDSKSARPMWRHYLELEPTGNWADVARMHLG